MGAEQMARDVPLAAIDTAEAAGLTYVSDHGTEGIFRKATRHGFDYYRTGGEPVRDEATLSRIRKLVLPPAWTDVWICPDADGHIQATGRDARGRKQYRYHDDWRAERDRHKYGKLCAFGRALPRLRRRVEADLAKRGLPREKVLAAVVRLLEITLIRVGNDEYAKANKSFGLTTLRKRHVTLSTAGAVFEFRGKSGIMHTTSFSDRRLARVLKGCGELKGQRLFQYLDEEGLKRPVESHDVNDYIRDALGDGFSAKDFRTWAGTLAAARALVLAGRENGATPTKKTVATCVKAVAGVLGNTPAVCRACYIHPAVFEAYEAGTLSPKLAGATRAAELALLKLLDEAGACG
jgi:DNA topoisomerase-1